MKVLVLKYDPYAMQTTRDRILTVASLLSDIAGIDKYPPGSVFGRAFELAVNAIEGIDAELEEIAAGDVRVPLGDIPEKTVGYLAMELTARKIVYDIVSEQWIDKLDAELQSVSDGLSSSNSGNATK